MGLRIGRLLGGALRTFGGPVGNAIANVGAAASRTIRGGGPAASMTLAQVGGGIQGPVLRGPQLQIGGGQGLRITGPSYQGPSAQLQVGGGGGGGGDGCPKGFHRNKALIRAETNPTPSNLARAQAVRFPCVRNRRMNPLNVRALNRGVRRMHGAAKTLKTVLRLTGQKTKGRVIPKRRRKKS